MPVNLLEGTWRPLRAYYVYEIVVHARKASHAQCLS